MAWRGECYLGEQTPIEAPTPQNMSQSPNFTPKHTKNLITKIIFVSAEYFNPIIRFRVFFNSSEVAECVLLKTEGEDHFKVKPSAVCRNFHQPRNKENEKRLFLQLYPIFKYLVCVLLILYEIIHF